jgi:DNA-binding beta-propeller fold protein YncE
VPGGVVSSRGTLPDSIAVHGDLVYVANSGPGHSNYTGFRFFQGHLLRIPGSTVTLASDAAPGDVLFNGTGTVSAFKDHRNGRLSPIGASPFPDHQMAPCWVEITHDGQFLFTVNTASGTVSAYQIAASGGKLTQLGTSPFPLPAGAAPAGIVIS